MAGSLWPRWGPWGRGLGTQAWERGSCLWAGSKCVVQSSGEPQGRVRVSEARGSGSRKLQCNSHHRSPLSGRHSAGTGPGEPHHPAFPGSCAGEQGGPAGWSWERARGVGLVRVTCALMAVTGGQEGGRWGPCCALAVLCTTTSPPPSLCPPPSTSPAHLTFL